MDYREYHKAQWLPCALQLPTLFCAGAFALNTKKYEFVKNFQTISLHRNEKEIILKVGGGRNGKRR